MISFGLFTALSTFYFTMFVTPGPNNTMLTTSGMKFGFLKTLPHLIGIPLGHIIQIGLCCYGLINIFLVYPELQFYMRIICFLYLMYLSWKMIGSFSLSQKKSGKPLDEQVRGTMIEKSQYIEKESQEESKRLKVARDGNRHEHLLKDVNLIDK